MSFSQLLMLRFQRVADAAFVRYYFSLSLLLLLMRYALIFAISAISDARHMSFRLIFATYAVVCCWRCHARYARFHMPCHYFCHLPLFFFFIFCQMFIICQRCLLISHCHVDAADGVAFAH